MHIETIQRYEGRGEKDGVTVPMKKQKHLLKHRRLKNLKPQNNGFKLPLKEKKTGN